jgi:hypothetical protein
MHLPFVAREYYGMKPIRPFGALIGPLLAVFLAAQLLGCTGERQRSTYRNSPCSSPARFAELPGDKVQSDLPLASAGSRGSHNESKSAYEVHGQTPPQEYRLRQDTRIRVLGGGDNDGERRAIQAAVAWLENRTAEPIDVELKVTSENDGSYRVFIDHVIRDKQGRAGYIPGGHCMLTVLHSGDIVDAFLGL